MCKERRPVQFELPLVPFSLDNFGGICENAFRQNFEFYPPRDIRIMPVPKQRIATLLASGEPETEVELGGWVRTRRDSKHGFSFIELNDGSCM